MPSIQLTILTLNCWGLYLISKDRLQRMQAIADFLVENEYDVVCLQELWVKSDYILIRDKVEEKLPHSHYFYSGFLGSGMCFLSKFPLEEVFFHQWPVNGYVHKILHGDWFGGKGVGLCRIRVKNFTINVYTAHLHAKYNENDDEYMAHRVLQAFDTAQFIRLTGNSADLVVLAGDLNTEPEDHAYKILVSATGLTDSYKQAIHTDSYFGTNEGYRNSYTDSKLIKKKFSGKRIDYIMYRNSQDTAVTLKNYKHPLPHRVPDQEFSYSDHEAVSVVLELSRINYCKPGESSNSSYKSILEYSMTIFDNAMIRLRKQFYFFCIITAILFFILLFTVDMEAPFEFIQTYYLLRIILTGFMFYTFIMAALWKDIECNAILAGKLNMENDLKQLLTKDNSKNC